VVYVAVVDAAAKEIQGVKLGSYEGVVCQTLITSNYSRM